MARLGGRCEISEANQEEDVLVSVGGYENWMTLVIGL